MSRCETRSTLFLYSDSCPPYACVCARVAVAVAAAAGDRVVPSQTSFRTYAAVRRTAARRALCVCVCVVGVWCRYGVLVVCARGFCGGRRRRRQYSRPTFHVNTTVPARDDRPYRCTYRGVRTGSRLFFFFYFPIFFFFFLFCSTLILSRETDYKLVVLPSREVYVPFRIPLRFWFYNKRTCCTIIRGQYSGGQDDAGFPPPPPTVIPKITTYAVYSNND